MRLQPFVCCGLLALAHPVAQAEVFKCVDSAGRVTYQEVACPPAAKSESVRTPSTQAAAPAEAPKEPKPAAAPAKAAPAEDPIEGMRTACIESVMRDGKTTWERVAFSDPKAGAFPLQEFRASAEAFCGCVSGRVKASVPPAEVEAEGASAFASFGTEALQGGQCAPTGAWSRLMTRQF